MTLTSEKAYALYPITEENAATTVPHMLELIKALAIYEKEPLSSVEATEDLLHKALFGDATKGGRKYCECVLAYAGGEPGSPGSSPVGMAVYFYTFSTWTGRGGLYLEDLFVTEQMRGKGVGKALFGYLGKLCQQLELPRMDWVVLDWNVDAQEVYRRMGAVHKKEWFGMRLQDEPLAKLAQ
ncbi:GNAT family N-acetyltransferase [Sporobolomyces koalae]|uniref:GNAT family N-acetyltransferase n=1 Tax=Sporobolomyces koalae TaxID=500713 RepID=UPI00317D46AF